MFYPDKVIFKHPVHQKYGADIYSGCYYMKDNNELERLIVHKWYIKIECKNDSEPIKYNVIQFIDECLKFGSDSDSESESESEIEIDSNSDSDDHSHKDIENHINPNILPKKSS